MVFNRHPENGFGLLEVIIASALIAVIGLGLATLITDMGKSQRLISERTEQKNYAQMVKASIQAPTVMSKTANTTPTGPN